MYNLTTHIMFILIYFIGYFYGKFIGKAIFTNAGQNKKKIYKPTSMTIEYIKNPISIFILVIKSICYTKLTVSQKN